MTKARHPLAGRRHTGPSAASVARAARAERERQAARRDEIADCAAQVAAALGELESIADQRARDASQEDRERWAGVWSSCVTWRTQWSRLAVEHGADAGKLEACTYRPSTDHMTILRDWGALDHLGLTLAWHESVGLDVYLS